MKAIKIAWLLLVLVVANCQDYYSTKLAQRLTQISAISYESESSILNWNCQLCLTVPFSYPVIVKNDSNSVFGVIGYSPQYKKIVVAFRGSVDLANWILNLKTIRTSYPLCEGCSVHIGFNQGFNSVKSQVDVIIGSLRDKHPEASIAVTGHSLGGALAVMAAAYLQDKYDLVEMLYTMGQPRVGNDKFAQFMTTFIPNTFRIVHYADQIPHIPQSILGFKHSGWQIWYKQDMQSYNVCPSENKECSNQLNIFQVNQADHKMVLYLLIKADTSFLADFSSYLKFVWLRLTTINHIFNLDIKTMALENRQVKEALHRLQHQTKIANNVQEQ